MRLLVTGSRGFLGRQLVPRLLQAGHQVVDLYPSETGQGIDLTQAAPIRDYVAQVRPDMILHLAGRSAAASTATECYRVNVLGTANLMEAAGGIVPRVLSLGSAAEYGLRAEPLRLREQEDCRPENAYGCAKLVQSELVRVLAARFGMQWSVIRGFNFFGPQQPPGLVVPDLLARLEAHRQQKKQPFQLQRADDVRDFVPVRVVCEMIVRLVADERSEGIYNACSGQGVRIADLLGWLADERGFGTALPLVAVPSPTPPTYSIGDPTRLELQLGHHWNINLEQEVRLVARTYSSDQ